MRRSTILVLALVLVAPVLAAKLPMGAGVGKTTLASGPASVLAELGTLGRETSSTFLLTPQTAPGTPPPPRATPVPFPPGLAPADCRIAPRPGTERDWLALLAGPAPASAFETMVRVLPAPPSLLAGEPADAETVDALLRTARELAACINAGDGARVTALYTDDYWRRILPQSLARWGGTPEDLAASYAAANARPPAPRPPGERTVRVAVEAARVLPDGRVGALVTLAYVGDDPYHGFLIFARIGDRWLIDDRVLFRTEEATPSGGATPVAPAPAATPVPGAAACRDQIAQVPERQIWELRGDCAADAPIPVPDGWTFDGKGHTVRLVDPPAGRFVGGAIERRGGSATVRNVRIDGTGLTPGCVANQPVVGVLFVRAGGGILGTTVVDLRRGGEDPCGSGIYVTGVASAPVVVSGNMVADPGDDGIVVADGAAATVSGNAVAGAGRAGIIAVRGATATVAGDNRVSGGRFGIAVSGAGTRGEVAGNIIEGAAVRGISIESGATAAMSGNSVRGVGDSGPATPSVAAATPAASPPAIAHGGALGIVVDGTGTRGTIDGNTVADPGDDGIVVRDEAEAVVSGNTVTGAPDTGILAAGGAKATVDGGNRLSGNAYGIVFEADGTTGTIDGNTVDRTAKDGIVVQQGADATVSGNTVSDTTETGILVLLGAHAVVSRNTVTNTGASGIYLGHEGTTADMDGNTVQRTGQAGIAVVEGSATVSGNAVTGAGEAGIVAASGATATIDAGNRVSGGQDGIPVTGAGTSAEIDGNSVEQAENIGIGIRDGATATVSGNAVTAPGRWGIVARGKGTRGTFDGNSVEDAGDEGILVEYGAEASVTGNTVTNAVEAGIVVVTEATARVTGGNRVSGGEFGIVVTGLGARGEIAGNTIEGARDEGIRIGSDAEADVTGNTVTGPPRAQRTEDLPVGIMYRTRAAGRVADNAVSSFFNDHPGGYACGIRIHRDAGDVDVSTNRFPAPGNETDLCDERPDAGDLATPAASPIGG